MSQFFPPDYTFVIVNPTSGTRRSRAKARQISNILLNRGYRIFPTERPGHATGLVASGLSDGMRALIVIGGDGTLLECIESLPLKMPIAYFPAGSVNLFALNFHIPDDPGRWMDMLESGELAEARFGLCNDRPFASTASVGFDAYIVKRLPASLKRLLHKNAFVIQFLIALFTWKHSRFSIKIDRESITGSATCLILSRGEHYGGQYRIFPGIHPGTGKLGYVILHGKSKWIRIKYGAGMLFGNLTTMKTVQAGDADEITVEADPDQYVQLDGDPRGITPIHFTMEGETRRVLVERRSP